MLEGGLNVVCKGGGHLYCLERKMYSILSVRVGVFHIVCSGIAFLRKEFRVNIRIEVMREKVPSLGAELTLKAVVHDVESQHPPCHAPCAGCAVVYMREYACKPAARDPPAGMSQRTFLKARAVMMWVHRGERRLKTAP